MHTPYAGVSCITHCSKRPCHNMSSFLLPVLLQMACLPKPGFVDLPHQLNVGGWLRQLAAKQAANGSIQLSTACLLAGHVRLVWTKQ